LPGSGGAPNGLNGLGFTGKPGNANASSTGVGIGGGITIITGGQVTIDNTTISGNTATTSNNDVNGAIIM
jgi:hypothetical protein